MNNFPAMTEEQRQALIEDLQEVIKVETHSVYGYAARIALAALTNDGQALARKVWSDLDRMASPEPFMRAAYESVMRNYTAPPAPVLKPIELNKGALMISAYTTDPMNEDPVLCLSKDGVIEAIRAAGYEVKP